MEENLMYIAGSWSFGIDLNVAQNIVIFVVDNSSSSHTDNHHSSVTQQKLKVVQK